jgi:YegS/Rv2252/BmrU family lipid kinase
VSVAIIINPVSGTGNHPEIGRRRAEQAASLASTLGTRAEIFLTERGGHARALAAAALERGASTVVAWGGDGTVNEVATALAFRDAALGVVPTGSGNGLARELGIPREPSGALAVALGGASRVIDCGEMDGRLFVNVAGIGFDAHVAHQFAATGLARRGFLRYLEIGARELWRFDADTCTVTSGESVIRERALVVAVANARQYGNGALIAPFARVDDGRLDVVVVASRPVWKTMMHVPRLFTGRIARVPGVSTLSTSDVLIESTRPTAYHVDGEPFLGGTSLRARVHPGALRVKTPAS